MKKILLLLIIIIPGVLTAQQLPYYSQYMMSDYFINPAVAGSKSEQLAFLSLRTQWVGFNGAPNTATAGFYGPWGKNVGLGGMFFNHNTGPIRQSGLQLSYAYHLKITGNSSLSLGLSGMFYQHVLHKNELISDTQNDPAITGGKDFTIAPDAAFGAYYYSKKYFAGFSIPQLFQNRLNYNAFNDSINSNKLVRHYFFHGGYKFEINDDFDVEPSLLLKAVLNVPVQVDINARVTYKDMVWLGASYRNKESVVVMLGVNKNNFVAGYSYDITLSNIRKYSTGSHELFLGLKILNLSPKSTVRFQ